MRKNNHKNRIVLFALISLVWSVGSIYSPPAANAASFDLGLFLPDTAVEDLRDRIKENAKGLRERQKLIDRLNDLTREISPAKRQRQNAKNELERLRDQRGLLGDLDKIEREQARLDESRLKERTKNLERQAAAQKLLIDQLTKQAELERTIEEQNRTLRLLLSGATGTSTLP